VGPEPEEATLFESARQRSGLSPAALWWAYFALGGQATPLQLAAILQGEANPNPHDHDLLSQALNERFTDLGLDSPVPYFST
jgi:hypothetical protein